MHFEEYIYNLFVIKLRIGDFKNKLNFPCKFTFDLFTVGLIGSTWLRRFNNLLICSKVSLFSLSNSICSAMLSWL